MFIVACSISYLYRIHERVQASRFSNWNSPSKLATPSAFFLTERRKISTVRPQTKPMYQLLLFI